MKQAKVNNEFIEAAIAGKITQVGELLAQGTDVNSVDYNHGNTALHFAAQNNNFDMVQFLCDKGINVNLKNRRGQNALHIAVEAKFDTIVKYLIAEANIDTKAQDNVGKVPLDMTATTPGYQKELRDFIAEHDLAQKKKLEAAENSNDTKLYEIDIYLKNGKKFPFKITRAVTPTKIIEQVAARLGVPELTSDMELWQDVMGKESAVAFNDDLITIRSSWKNDNPSYFKFMARLKRGCPEAVQLKFREAMYGDKPSTKPYGFE